MLKVKIEALPTQISNTEAIEKGYTEQIRFIWNRLKEGASVVIKCEKQIIPYIQQILKKKLQTEGKTISIIDGNLPELKDNLRISNMIIQFKNIINNTDKNKIFMLPYLDIITSSKHSLTMEGKEIMTIIHENPFLVMVAFEDPSFPFPELVLQAFPAKVELIGINRKALVNLITSNEARKFAVEELNVMEIYKYVSGLNPIRLRELMNIFAKKIDYNPDKPEMLKDYFNELRNYTVSGNTSLSSINLVRDIAGYEKVKEQIKDNILLLLEKINTLDNEKEIEQLESLIPKGLIFYGPPGTGKTLFAKGIAEAINATVYIISGPELKSKWVGEGEANIRRLFSQARSNAPSIIVFDEFDSIASARSLNNDSASEASHSMVNQLLTEIDGFRKEELVFVIGTTNFPEALDPAFLRPGRFEYKIEIPYPEYEDRKAILSLYNNKMQTNLKEEMLETLSNWSGRLTDMGTPYAGDHLNALLRNLKRFLIKENKSELNTQELSVWLKSLIKTNQFEEGEDEVIAVHELGHTLMLKKYHRLGELKQVTLESGLSNIMGMVETKHKNRNVYTENYLRGEIGVCLGGYLAEKIIFEQVSNGAAQDLSTATLIAEDMVAKFGMANGEIPRNYTDKEGNINPYFYNSISNKIDILLLEIKEEVYQYLLANKDLLKELSKSLIEKRTMLKDELIKVIGL